LTGAVCFLPDRAKDLSAPRQLQVKHYSVRHGWEDNIKSLLKKGKGRLRTIIKWLIKAGYFVHGKQSLLSIKDEILLL